MRFLPSYLLGAARYNAGLRLRAYHSSMKFCGILLLFSLASTIAAAAKESPCTVTQYRTQHEAAVRVREAARSLATIEAATMETDVPPEAQIRIPKLKAAVQDFVPTVFACLPDDQDARPVERLLNRMAGVADLSPNDQPSDINKPLSGFYGTPVHFEVTAQGNNREVFGVLAAFGVECGDDAVLFVFEREGKTWIEKITATSNPYKSVGDAWGDLQYSISPPDPTGHWFVLLARDHPWCSSRFNGIEIRILRPGATPGQPVVILNVNDGLNRGDINTRLSAKADMAEVIFDKPGQDVETLLDYVGIQKYAIRGDQAVRVQPVARDLRGFIEEWLGNSWDLARILSSNTPDVQAAHEAIRKKQQGEHATYFGHGKTRQCGPEMFEAEMFDGLDRLANWYFTIRKLKDGWLVERVAQTENPACRAK